jgi:hypothetical protein
VAFVGRVLAVVDTPLWMSPLLGWRERESGREVAILAVENVWQGPRPPIFAVTSGAPCGTAFEVGRTYIVHGQRRGLGPIETNSCQPTHEVT